MSGGVMDVVRDEGPALGSRRARTTRRCAMVGRGMLRIFHHPRWPRSSALVYPPASAERSICPTLRSARRLAGSTDSPMPARDDGPGTGQHKARRNTPPVEGCPHRLADRIASPGRPRRSKDAPPSRRGCGRHPEHGVMRQPARRREVAGRRGPSHRPNGRSARGPGGERYAHPSAPSSANRSDSGGG